MGTAMVQHPVQDRVKPSFVIFDIRALWSSELSISTVFGCQKITNNGLTQSGTGFFMAQPIWQQWSSKG